MPPRIPFKRPTPPREAHRVNERIRARRVKLVDENGVLLGEMATSKAVEIACERGRDLVEVDAKSRPPVRGLCVQGRRSPLK